MRQFLHAAMALFLTGCVFATQAADPVKPPAKDKTAQVFGLDKVWNLHMEISAKDWETMQPTRTLRLWGQPPKEQPKDKPIDPKPADEPKPEPAPPRGAFGYDFAYVKANLDINGKNYKDVGVRFKGNSSYMMTAQSLKRPLKLDFDRFVEDQDFHGLKMVNLNNNSMDPTQLREALGFSVFQAAGLPTPRTAFLELRLSVPGKYDKELAGLYTLIEQVNTTFLKRHFKNPKGMLLKPEGFQNLPYLGPDWKPYGDMYRPDDEPDAKAKERLIEFTRLVNFADDETFNKNIGKFLDIDLFLRYLAACSAMVNIDSFVVLGHNYYLYLNPDDNRFVMIPWDLNHTFGGFTMFGGGDQQMEWAIKKPYLGSNRLTERLLAVKEHEDGYRKHLKNLIEAYFHSDKLLANIDRMDKAVQKIAAEEKAAEKKRAPAGGPPNMFGNPPDLRKFVSQRAKSLAAQLDGKSEGKEIKMGFGPGMGQTGLGGQLQKPIFQAADDDKDGKLSLEELKTALAKLHKLADKAGKDSVDEKAFAAALTKIMPRQMGFGMPPPGGDAVNYQAVHLAGYAFHRADTVNLRMSAKQLIAFAEQLFRDGDQNQDGVLDDKELGARLNAIPPSPQLFNMPKAELPKKP